MESGWPPLLGVCAHLVVKTSPTRLVCLVRLVRSSFYLVHYSISTISEDHDCLDRYGMLLVVAKLYIFFLIYLLFS